MKARGTDIAKAGCKYLGRLYSQMDCQAFVEQAMRDAGLSKDLAGSNAWYRAMTWTGTPEECRKMFGKIPIGTFLFILEKDGKEPAKYRNDGIGNASHIGIYTGMSGNEMVALAIAAGDTGANGYNFGSGAIHSSATKGHVCTSNFNGRSIKGGWNRVGLWNQIEYDNAINNSLSGVPNDAANDENQAPTEPIGEGVVFASSGTSVKMRARPSSSCGRYWDVPIGEMVEILREGDWDRIRWKGITGYMKSEFVHKGETMQTIEPEQTPNDRIRLAKVYAEKGSTVKMRARPSSSCGIYDDVPIGVTVAVIHEGKVWSKIRYAARSGWYMMTKFLRFEEE